MRICNTKAYPVNVTSGYLHFLPCMPFVLIVVRRRLIFPLCFFAPSSLSLSCLLSFASFFHSFPCTLSLAVHSVFSVLYSLIRDQCVNYPPSAKSSNIERAYGIFSFSYIFFINKFSCFCLCLSVIKCLFHTSVTFCCVVAFLCGLACSHIIILLK